MKPALSFAAFLALSALGGGLWVAGGFAVGSVFVAVFGRG